jgi:hypothetical protein
MAMDASMCIGERGHFDPKTSFETTKSLNYSSLPRQIVTRVAVESCRTGRGIASGQLDHPSEHQIRRRINCWLRVMSNGMEIRSPMMAPLLVTGLHKPATWYQPRPLPPRRDYANALKLGPDG